MAEKSDAETTPTTLEPSTRSSRTPIVIAVLAVLVVAVYMLINATLDRPEDATLQENNGRITADEQAERFHSQIEHLKELHEKDPNNFEVTVGLGNSYFDAAMPDEAITYYRKALAIQPDNLDVKTDLATMLREDDQPKEAVSLLEEIIAQDSSHAQALFNLGVIAAFDLDDKQRAIWAWSRYIKINPTADVIPSLEREIARLQAATSE